MGYGCAAVLPTSNVFGGAHGSQWQHSESARERLPQAERGRKVLPVLQVSDPGDTAIGNKIRKLLKYGSKGIDVRTEVMLFMASRTQLVAEILNQALSEGKIVLCDRYISSTCAYQGAGGYPIEKIIKLGYYAVGDVWPDVTIILDIPPEKGRERTGVKRSKKIQSDYEQNHFFDSPTTDMFDSRTLEYHRKVRKVFLSLEGIYPGIIKILDVSTDSIEQVHENLKKIIIETVF